LTVTTPAVKGERNKLRLAILKINFAVILLHGISSFSHAENVNLLPESATKRVLIPQYNIGTEWRTNLEYDDSAWLLCEGEPGGIGYERSTGYDPLITLDVESRMHESGGNPNPCCYVRICFNVDQADLSQIEFLTLNMRYDDGFIAYLNGAKITEANAPASPSWNSFAPTDHEANSQVEFDVSSFTSSIVAGENLLAIHGFNVNNTSSDFLILPELEGRDTQFDGFTSTTLPLIIIDTNGHAIPDEPKIQAIMKIINNGAGKINTPSDTPTDYDGEIGIEVRGAYSSTFPQKPYGIETRDEQGENNNVPLLGMPAENDWALITNYNEKSLVRTTLAFDLFRLMGQYAPRACLCEVLVNSVYQGIYVFTEKIKRDDNRVHIATLNPYENTGDDVTGGYIVKIDYYDAWNSWKSNYHPIGYPRKDVYFVYYYPKPDVITQEQRDYIQGFFEHLEDALYSNNFNDHASGYRAYIDVPSFIDYFILSEVSRNVDGYKKSRYWYKDKDSNGGLLKAGPVWDFDWAWKNIQECFFANTDGSGWGYKTNDCNNRPATPGWYVRLLQDGYFTNRLIERYTELRTNVLDLDRINAYIDSVRVVVDDAQKRHFELWPIERDYKAPEVDPPSRTYDQEINKLKEWIRIRIGWLDENIPLLRNEIVVNVEQNAGQVLRPPSLMIFPNPSSEFIRIKANESINQIVIYNALGQCVYRSKMKIGRSQQIRLPDLTPGVYFLKASFGDQNVNVQKVIISR
jgi:hypothetical protein